MTQHDTTQAPADASFFTVLRLRVQQLRSGQLVRNAHGMTLIEIMIVVAIMAAIMSVVGYYVTGYSENANKQLAETQIKSIKNNVEMYRLAKRGRVPQKLDDLVAMNLMEKIPDDPWGNAYVYQSSGTGAKILSGGPDGSPNTGDDILVEIK